MTGLLYPTQNRTGGPYDPATGHLHTLSRVDLFRWQRQLPYKLYPVYVNLVTLAAGAARHLPRDRRRRRRSTTARTSTTPASGSSSPR